MSNWIKSSERLPEASGDYICICSSGWRTEFPYSAKHKKFNVRDSASEEQANERCINALYWMPFPDPPEDVRGRVAAYIVLDRHTG